MNSLERSEQLIPETGLANVLAVDLDGSLIFTDLLYETFVRVVFKKPWLLFLAPFWILKGIAFTKSKLSRLGVPDIRNLPYNSDLINWLSEEKKKGRRLVLCTGSHISLANKVSNELGIFDEVLATDDQTNLTGSKKATALVEAYGEKNFSYVGNEKKDLKVWKKASSAVVVNSRPHLAERASQHCLVEKSFEKSRPTLRVIFKAIRVHQWSKNALVFVPLLTAHKIFDLHLVMLTALSFLAFGLCASATYILNDLSDLDSDREHWKKRYRPMASGALSIKLGVVLCSAMLLCSIFIALAFLPLGFIVVLGSYTAITLGYSFWFKRLQTVDIVVLASLYTVRLFAGSAAVSVAPSFWLLSFSMFIFLCLAIVKRISEIMKKQDQDPTANKLSGRGYFISDLSVLMSLGSSSGMVAILVFAMYVNSPTTIELYRSPMLLWAICPIIGYWVIRVLVMTARGQIDEDPISFAIRDKRSWIAGAAAIAAVIAAWQIKI